MAPGWLRCIARLAMAVGVAALLVAAMGVYPEWLAVFAVIVSLVANAVLMSFATRDVRRASGANEPHADLDYSPVAGGGAQSRLDLKTCAQGYASVPITMIAVISLAMYKADLGAGEDGDRAAAKIAAETFLKYVGCGGLLVRGNRRRTVQSLHTKFIGAALLAGVVYVIGLGLRALFSEHGYSQTRALARLAFAVAVGLLLFGAVGYFPIVLCGSACAVSFLASTAMLCDVSAAGGSFRQAETDGDDFADSAGDSLAQGSLLSTHVQAHVFSAITLCCIYCLGCVILEHAVWKDGGLSPAEVKLRLVGFELALAAAVWLAITLAIRSFWKARRSTRAWSQGRP